MHRFKVLLLNTGYCVGLNGSPKQYLRYFHRYFFCPRRIQQRVLASIDTLIAEIKPDLCCFMELHRESKLLRRFNQLHRLINETYRYFHIANKYCETRILGRLPFFRRKSNGFLAKHPLPYRTHFFSRGGKRLIYEIILENSIHLFMAHFSLHREIRRKQFEEMAELVKSKKRVIVCGDFNIFRGFHELKPLLEAGNLKIVNQKNHATFPSCNPKKHLDLFLCSPDVPVTDVRVLKNVHISDHLPVVLEFSIS